MAPPQPPTLILGVALTAIDNAASFREEARYQGFCACCHRTGRFDAHHVLAKAHCKRYGAPRFSPDNALRLCSGGPERCHERHTTHRQLVPVARLRDENIAFIVEWLGPGHGALHLQRYYEGSDPRLDRLLEVA